MTFTAAPTRRNGSPSGPGSGPRSPTPREQRAAASREARTRLLLEGPIGPTLARLAAPNVVAMSVMSAMSVAEGYFAGRMGVTALAGLALVFPLVMMTQMLSGGAIGGAISSSIARTLGAGDVARAGGLAVAAWIIAAGVAAATTLIMGLHGRAIFGLLGGRGEALEAAVDYAAVFFPGCIALWLCHGTLSIVRGAGNMAMPSLVLFLVSLCSIPLSGALGLGWGPFPAMGMAGLATGLVAAYGVGAVAALVYVGAGRAGISPRDGLARLRGALFVDIMRVGLIACVNTAMSITTVLVVVGLVGAYGGPALAGYGLGARLEFLMIPIAFGIGVAMTAMVGANMGAGARERALKVAWTGSFAAAAIIGGIGAVLAVFPDLWLRLFLDAPETGALGAGRAYFRLVAPCYALLGLGLALFFASQGAGRLVWPMIGSFSRMAVAFGGAAALTAFTDLGLQGVFVAIALGMLAFGAITALSVKLTGWR